MMNLTLVPCERVLVDPRTEQPSFINVLTRVIVGHELNCVLAYQITSDVRLPSPLKLHLTIRRPGIDDKERDFEIRAKSNSILSWIDINKLRVESSPCTFELLVTGGKGSGAQARAVSQVLIESRDVAKRASTSTQA
jgi:hypothetical protein